MPQPMAISTENHAFGHLSEDGLRGSSPGHQSRDERRFIPLMVEIHTDWVEALATIGTGNIFQLTDKSFGFDPSIILSLSVILCSVSPVFIHHSL